LLFPWSIRNKLLLGIAMLFFIVAILSFSSFQGVYAYRWLARSISNERATELRLAMELSYSVGELRSVVSQVRRGGDFISVGADVLTLREKFRVDLLKLVNGPLKTYKETLREVEAQASGPPDRPHRLPEWQTVEQIQGCIAKVDRLNQDDAWVFNVVQVDGLDSALADLHNLTLELPRHLQQRMHHFSGEVRGQYRTWIVLTWTSSLLAVAILAFLLKFFHQSVFRPLQVLIRGSRRVSRDGDFQYRIQLNTQDEVAELAGSMNDMTERFLKIRNDLDCQIRERDEQVRQRTKEVVRQEQLASVGFLAAGVAHEINNPLAAIAWAAESLEMRLHDILEQDDEEEQEDEEGDIAIARKYLRSIQEEAFRCKGITERLLDFSRMGDMQKQDTDLAELVEGVIDMVRHLGKYREKTIQFECDQPVIAPVNAQEMKQVVLNLITNALDSLDPGGHVRVSLHEFDGEAELMVRDNGCGMTAEVQRHLFEPFYSRRRDGQGTGLGLSISYRIIQDHGGRIVPLSDGPGQGSEFRVSLPMVARHEEKRQEARQVA
jgi:signal transduction histidine kinase